MRYITLAAACAALAAPAFAEAHLPSGDADSGEALFQRQCVTCHVVATPEGKKLAGRNARSGPNLYGIAGRKLGGVEGFRYSDALKGLGEEGMAWDEESFAGYVQDPTGWLREATGNKRARGKMAYKVRSPEDAADLYAYLHLLAPPADDGTSAGAALTN